MIVEKQSRASDISIATRSSGTRRRGIKTRSGAMKLQRCKTHVPLPRRALPIFNPLNATSHFYNQFSLLWKCVRRECGMKRTHTPSSRSATIAKESPLCIRCTLQPANLADTIRRKGIRAEILERVFDARDDSRYAGRYNISGAGAIDRTAIGRIAGETSKK